MIHLLIETTLCQALAVLSVCDLQDWTPVVDSSSSSVYLTNKALSPLMNHGTRPLLGFALSLLTAFMWGVLPLFMLLALQDMDAISISFYRFLFAFLFVLLMVFWKREMPVSRQFSDKRWLWILLAGGALSCNYGAYVLSLEKLDPESAQVIIQLAPFLLMVGGVFLFKESFTKLQLLGAAILLTGFALFFDNKWHVLLSSVGQYTSGVLIMLFAAITWVVYALLQKSLLDHFTARQMTLLIYGLGSLMLLPLSSVTQLLDLTWLSGLALLFCCFNTIIAYGSFTYAMSIWQASKVSAVIALAPIFTILSSSLAVSFFPQYFSAADLTRTAYAGAFCVVIGSMVTALGKPKK